MRYQVRLLVLSAMRRKVRCKVRLHTLALPMSIAMSKLAVPQMHLRRACHVRKWTLQPGRQNQSMPEKPYFPAASKMPSCPKALHPAWHLLALCRKKYGSAIPEFC